MPQFFSCSAVCIKTSTFFRNSFVWTVFLRQDSLRGNERWSSLGLCGDLSFCPCYLISTFLYALSPFEMELAKICDTVNFWCSAHAWRSPNNNEDESEMSQAHLHHHAVLLEKGTNTSRPSPLTVLFPFSGHSVFLRVFILLVSHWSLQDMRERPTFAKLLGSILRKSYTSLQPDPPALMSEDEYLRRSKEAMTLVKYTEVNDTHEKTHPTTLQPENS